MKSIVLCSGGLDSTTLLYWLIEQKEVPTPLFINYGQHAFQTELTSLQSVLPEKWSKRLVILDISSMFERTKSRRIDEPNLWNDRVQPADFYLPYRNLLLLTVAAAYGQAHDYEAVYAAFINSNHAQEIDASAQFLLELENILSEYGAIEVRLPFREMSKYEVAKLGIELNAPIGKTFSCQASSHVPCGACPNCVDRLDALNQLAEEFQAGQEN